MQSVSTCIFAQIPVSKASKCRAGWSTGHSDLWAHLCRERIAHIWKNKLRACRAPQKVVEKTDEECHELFD